MGSANLSANGNFGIKNGGGKFLIDRVTKLVKRRKPPTVFDALNMYWNDYLSYKSYARCARYRLRAIAERLGKCDLSKISRSEIETYKRERIKDARGNVRARANVRAVSPRTVQMELQLFSTAINFAVDNGVLAFNPIKRFIRVPQVRPQKVVLDDGYENGRQWEAIYNAIHVRIKPVILTLYETGMRPKECFNMRWNWLSEKMRGRWIITIPCDIDKVGNERDIPVSKRLLDMFRAIKPRSSDDYAFVFPAQRNSLRARANISTAFHRALTRCGLSDRNITPYALRRTRLTIWDAIDGDACRYAAGHAVNEVHLKHYVRISYERLFKLVGLDFTPPRYKT